MAGEALKQLPLVFYARVIFDTLYNYGLLVLIPIKH
jgi:hypothetical protein